MYVAFTTKNQKESSSAGILSCSVTGRIGRQGIPAATTPAGMSCSTTLPAPMTEPFPIVTPPQTTALAPIQTSSSIVIGFEVPMPLERCCGSIECPAQLRQTPGAIKAPAPIWTGEVSRMVQL